MNTTETAQSADQKLLEKIDLPTFIAGLVAGFLAFNNEPWWTLTSPTNSHILSILASPFYLQISATSISATLPIATIIGAVSRVLLIMSSFTLIGSSFRLTAWWRPLATWVSLASLTETFFSLFLLIHAGQATLYSTYGAGPPTSGTVTYPSRIIGTDLNTYLNPSLTASFNVDFYLGILGLTIVGTTTLIKMLRDQDLITATLPGVKEFFLSPPYRHVWISTNDKELNPLSQDPENTSDDKLLQSFGKIYSTVQPGGTLNIILPAWATSVSDRFQKLLVWTGFAQESTETIYRTPSKAETQLRFKKPLKSKDQDSPTGAEFPDSEPSVTPVLAETELGSSLPDTPPQLAIAAQPEWASAKATKQERAMLKSAISLLSKRTEPAPYRELLNQVYMDLVEKKVKFDSARQIETALLKHVGRELAVIEEADTEGFRTQKKWALGEDATEIAQDGPSVLSRLSNHRPHVSPVMRLLKKWQRKPRYKKNESAEEL